MVFFLIFTYFWLHWILVLQCSGSLVVVRGLCCPKACGIFVFWPGIKPPPSTLESGFPTTDHQEVLQPDECDQVCLSLFGLMKEHPIDRWLLKQQKLVSHGYGGWQCKIKTSASWCPVRVCFPGYYKPCVSPVPLVSWHRGSVKGTNPIMRWSPPKDPASSQYRLGVWLSAWILRDYKHSVCDELTFTRQLLGCSWQPNLHRGVTPGWGCSFA